MPATTAAPVPADPIPPLTEVGDARPVIYSDGCHLSVKATVSGPCAYADTRSSTKVVLIGDSHAAQWFPAVEAIALERGWRLESLTKSACPAADVPVWNVSLKRAYSECEQWRAATLERIARERPALVIVSNTRNIDLVVDGKRSASLTQEALWDSALARTLAALSASAGEVVLLGDTPKPDSDPPGCLARNLANALSCARSWSKSVSPIRIAAERDVSAAAGLVFVDPTPWICPSDPCPVIIDRYVVYMDGGHIAAPFARALAPYLDAALPPVP